MVITHYIEVSCFIIGTLCAIAILKKNSRYLANKTLALGIFLIGVYQICLFIYDVINEYWAINLFLRIGMISLLISSLLQYYTMIIIMKSAKGLKKHVPSYVYFFVCLIASVYFASADFITQHTSHIGNVNISIGLIPLAMIIGILLYLTVNTIIITYQYGIKTPPSDKVARRKIRSFFGGLLLLIPTILINIVSQITSNDVLGAIFDALTFFILLIALLFFAFSSLNIEDFLQVMSRKSVWRIIIRNILYLGWIVGINFLLYLTYTDEYFLNLGAYNILFSYIAIISIPLFVGMIYRDVKVLKNETDLILGKVNTEKEKIKENLIFEFNQLIASNTEKEHYLTINQLIKDISAKIDDLD